MKDVMLIIKRPLVEELRVLTDTGSVGCFGQTTGAQVDAGVAPPRVFALLIQATHPLSALVYV